MPPCSSAQRVPGANNERNFQPISAEPINDKNAIRESDTNCSAI